MKFIHTGDWHVREDKPRCRLGTEDDWTKFQIDCVMQVLNLAKERNCPIVHTGDLFHRSYVNIYILHFLWRTILEMNIPIYIMAGNHDLMYHSWENIDKSVFGIFWELTKRGKNGILREITEIGDYAHFGMEPVKTNSKLLFLHELVFRTEKERPGYIKSTKAKTAQELLNEHFQYEMIFLGDNHESFVYENNNRMVLNPGCLTIQTADMIDYKPSVFYVDTETKKVEQLFIDTGEDCVVTDEYLTKEKDRDERIDSFISAISEAKEVSMDFEGNLRMAMKKDEQLLGKDGIDLIEKLIEEVR